MQAACRFENGVGHHQGIGLSRPIAKHNGEELVIPKSGGTETYQLLAWSIVRGNFPHKAASIAGNTVPDGPRSTTSATSESGVGSSIAAHEEHVGRAKKGSGVPTPFSVSSNT